MSESERYLAELRRALPWRLRRHVVAELRTHLADGIAAETANGLDRGEAERLTIERLGPPDRVAAQVVADAPRSHRRIAFAVAAALVVAAAVASVALTHTSDATHAAATTAPRPRLVLRPVWIGSLKANIRSLRAGGRLVVVRQCYLSPSAGAATPVCASRP